MEQSIETNNSLFKLKEMEQHIDNALFKLSTHQAAASLANALEPANRTRMQASLSNGIAGP